MAKHRGEPHLKCRDTKDDVDNCYAGDQEVEEEALSFSDLPVELEQYVQLRQEDEGNSRDGSHSDSGSEFEFGVGFGSWLGSMSTQPLPEMCVADDLFFQGRILPLQHDDSGDRSFMKKSTDKTNGFTKGPVSRSDSVESGLISQVTSTSSRSGSKGSQHSSSGSIISTSTSFGSSHVAYSSASNRFVSCRSPSPQTGFPGSNKLVLVQADKIRSKSQRNSSSSSSSMWEFFRTGLVRTPDIELRNLKTRTNDNFNNSCDNNSKEEQEKGNKKKGVGLGILGGCKCTADSVATNLVLLRSDSSRIRNRRKSNAGSGGEEELRRKLMELIEIEDSRTRKPKKKEEATAEKHRDRLVSSWSRHQRTFEWVKELPHASAGGYYVLHQF